jgi:cation transport regulator
MPLTCDEVVLMPYKSISDLPFSIQHVLPVHAQEIYMSSYNNAHKQYFLKKNRRNPSDDLDTVCHKVAWTAVKQKYRKDNEGRWVAKE